MLKVMVESFFQCLTIPSFQQNPSYPLSGMSHSHHSAVAQHGALVAQLLVGVPFGSASAPFLWPRYWLPAAPAPSRGLLFQPLKMIWSDLSSFPVVASTSKTSISENTYRGTSWQLTCSSRSPAPPATPSIHPGPLPEVGVMGAAARPFMFRAAICCIWAAAKAAMGFR